MKNKIKAIKECPIRDSIVEIRFDTDVPKEAVFGMVYNAVKAKFKTVEELPISQLPPQMIESDPSLKYKSRHKLTSTEGYSLQVGPNVLLISAKMPYQGWSIFKEEIHYVLEEVSNIDLIRRVTRLGIRVINVFDRDVFDKIKLELTVISKEYKLIAPLIRTQIQSNGYFISTLQIAKQASFSNKELNIKGSMIDIDTFKDYTNDTSKTALKDEIEEGHKIEKEIFFDLLKEELITELIPTYV